ncbi:hypothetical protein IQ238_17475 [Pleurocapsales cyanobacterium LEGE 06147]|nr:hypothetical protein [Pleurocapsales cyanobacterium LEGE 06147]
MKKSIAYTWGSTAEERQMVFPCDRYIDNSDDVYFRAIDVKAPASILWKWLCQLKVSSYSYDFLDRLERIFFQGQERIPSPESPAKLIPGLEILAPDQRFMGVFKLVEFETNRHLTMIMDAQKAIQIFGDVVASYVIKPTTENTCRLILKGHVRYPKNIYGKWMHYVLPWGDLLMMRKQFVRLKHLAENQAGFQSL